MTAERYVLLGLAHVRTAWFTELARWTTAGSLPAEFVKCLSIEELRARVASGRPFSAAVLDGGLPVVDRDLLAVLAGASVPSLVVTPPGDGLDWRSLGAAAVLPSPLERDALVEALDAHARMIGSLDADAVLPADTGRTGAVWRGRLVAVTGRSGAGVSTVAAAVAQHLAADPRVAGDVVLVDLARHAHQALLHDARDVVPGIQEVVELHRSGRPSAEDLRGLMYEVPARGYRLVLGLRRAQDWVTVRAHAFDAALDGICRSARIVVADTDADLEGEEQTGSHDIGERNHMARTAVARADLVVLVAGSGTTGVHGLVGQLEELRAHGVPGDRILVVVNRAPRQPRARAELTRAIADLTGAAERPDPHVGPVYVGERRGVDGLHRDLARFPAAVAGPPGSAVQALLDLLPAASGERGVDDGPHPVVPGTLGRWHDDGEAAS